MALDVGVLLQVLFWGLYAGCIYILLATGLTLIFGVMKIVNFAHGELLMLGAYITATVFALTGINPYSIILLTMLILGVIGIAIERSSFRPIMGTGKLNEIFISLGLIYVIQNAAALIWGDERQVLTSPYQTITIPLGPIQMPVDYLIIILVTALVLVGLTLLLKKTSLGKAIRATSQNRKGAQIVGID
ncbi:MAG: branched-chain amino acid ABC-type transport system, permease component, partial [Methanomicrobiales archaeon]|nr:branched-chain amino acid ABC-type transport system, permease component [Methanomicrobiales archaeon]